MLQRDRRVERVRRNHLEGLGSSRPEKGLGFECGYEEFSGMLLFIDALMLLLLLMLDLLFNDFLLINFLFIDSFVYRFFVF